MAYDAVVIGGGLIGMMTARTLQLAGLKVALLEKNRLGGESSWAAAGILASFHPWRQNDAAGALIEASASAFPNLVVQLQEETGINCGLLHCGMLVANNDERERALDWARKHDTSIEVLDQAKLARLEPHLANILEGAILIPSAMQLQPRLLMDALRESLVLHGVKIFEGTEVRALPVRAGKVTGADTPQGNVAAGQVVVCSGAWAQQLLKTVSEACTDIVPVRGQILLFKTQQRLMSHILVQDERYLVPREDPYILCGSTMEHVGFDRNVTEEAKDVIRTWAIQRCPALEEAELVDHWTGLRPGTLRETPYICAHPEYENLYMNAGHFRSGIAMSIASADLVCELMARPCVPPQMVPYGW